MNALEQDVRRIESVKNTQGESAAEKAFRSEYSIGLLLGDKPEIKQEAQYFEKLGNTLVKDGVIPKIELTNLGDAIKNAEEAPATTAPYVPPGPIVVNGRVVGVEG